MIATLLTPGTLADWLDGRQEGALMDADPQGAINRCPSNAAVRPYRGEYLYLILVRQMFDHGG